MRLCKSKDCSNTIPEGSVGQKKYCSRSCSRKSSSAKYYAKKRVTEPEKVMYHKAKTRAKDRNLEFDIDLKDVIIPKICPVLGLELQPNHDGSSKYNPESPSLDRIDSSKGYVKGNVRVISQRANVLKADATLEEMEAICSDLRQLRKDFSI